MFYEFGLYFIICNIFASGVDCFGPSAAAARIESSKEFAKDLMRTHGIPTARWSAFSDSAEASEFIQRSIGLSRLN